MNQLSFKERLIAIIQDLPVDRQKDLLNYLENQKQGYRKSLRKDCDIAADYTIRNEKFRDFITNISAGGVYVRTAQAHSPGQEISMDFRITHYPKPIRVFGRIVRTDTNGFAVEFFGEMKTLLDDLGMDVNGAGT